MSDISITSGPWFVNSANGLNIIQNEEGKEIGLVEETFDAALMASSKILLETLIDIHEKAKEIKNLGLRDEIEELISNAFEKLNAEVS